MVPATGAFLSLSATLLWSFRPSLRWLLVSPVFDVCSLSDVSSLFDISSLFDVSQCLLLQFHDSVIIVLTQYGRMSVLTQFERMSTITIIREGKEDQAKREQQLEQQRRTKDCQTNKAFMGRSMNRLLPSPLSLVKRHKPSAGVEEGSCFSSRSNEACECLTVQIASCILPSFWYPTLFPYVSIVVLHRIQFSYLITRCSGAS